MSELTYTYDAVGNRTGQVEAGGAVTTWTYDEVGQLIGEQRAGGDEEGFDIQYQYDGAGNRTLRTADGVTTTYTYSPANRLQTAVSPDGVTTYTHDKAGNRKQVNYPGSGGISYFAYDAAGRMTQAETPGSAGPVTLTYNADGQRVRKETAGGDLTQYLYDFNNLLQEFDGDDDPVRSYTATDDEYGDLLSEYDELDDTGTPGEGEFYRQFDAQANLEAMTDDAGSITQKFKFQAFGLPASSGQTGWANLTAQDWSTMSPADWSRLPVNPSSRLAWGGQKQYYLDPETELYLLGMGSTGGTSGGGRYYDPETGRFLSEDRVRYGAGDNNLFRYVANDPINKNDPSGKDPPSGGLTAIGNYGYYGNSPDEMAERARSGSIVGLVAPPQTIPPKPIVVGIDPNRLLVFDQTPLVVTAPPLSFGGSPATFNNTPITLKPSNSASALENIKAAHALAEYDAAREAEDAAQQANEAYLKHLQENEAAKSRNLAKRKAARAVGIHPDYDYEQFVKQFGEPEPTDESRALAEQLNNMWYAENSGMRYLAAFSVAGRSLVGQTLHGLGHVQSSVFDPLSTGAMAEKLGQYIKDTNLKLPTDSTGWQRVGETAAGFVGAAPGMMAGPYAPVLYGAQFYDQARDFAEANHIPEGPGRTAFIALSTLIGAAGGKVFARIGGGEGATVLSSFLRSTLEMSGIVGFQQALDRVVTGTPFTLSDARDLGTQALLAGFAAGVIRATHGARRPTAEENRQFLDEANRQLALAKEASRKASEEHATNASSAAQNPTEEDLARFENEGGGQPQGVGNPPAPKVAEPTPTPTANADATVESAGSRVYRVQGGTPPKVSWERVQVLEDGSIRIAPEPGKTNQTKLYITIDDPQRVRVYLEENRPGGHIVSFEVDPEFVRDVRANAISQAAIRSNAGTPEISDPTKTSPDVAAKLKKGGSSAYGLPAEWIAKLEKAARAGTFRIER